MKTIINSTVFILCIISALCTFNIVKPYWDRYWAEMQMEAAAVYGTKNSIAKARNILVDKMMEKGFYFEVDDFVIERDENNSVSINLAYFDEISVFGVRFKELEFNLETTVHEVKTF